MSDSIDTRDMLTILKDGISRGIRVFNVRSKEAYDTLKIKNSIRQLRIKRRDAVLEMGNAIYRSYKHKGDISVDSAVEKCAEIERIEGEIAACEEELRIVHLNAGKALGDVKALASPRGPEGPPGVNSD